MVFFGNHKDRLSKHQSSDKHWNSQINSFRFLILFYHIFCKILCIIIMGNTQTQPPTTNSKPPAKKFIIELKDRDIIIDYKSKTRLTISDVSFFPSGFEGLRLWDSNIILARYMFMNKDLFKGKKIIQLCSGTGIASISAKKFTQASLIACTDYHRQITQNVLHNCKKNGIMSGMIIAAISWKQYATFKNTFDFVIGADLITKSCPTDLLEKCLRKLLNIGGYAILVLPKRSLELTIKFLEGLDKSQFQWSKSLLTDEIYIESPLLNQVQGFQEFPLISEGQFYLCTIQKIKNITIDQDEQQPQIKKQVMKAEQKENGFEMKQIEHDKQIKQQKDSKKIQLPQKKTQAKYQIVQMNKQANIQIERKQANEQKIEEPAQQQQCKQVSKVDKEKQEVVMEQKNNQPIEEDRIEANRDVEQVTEKQLQGEKKQQQQDKLNEIEKHIEVSQEKTGKVEQRDEQQQNEEVSYNTKGKDNEETQNLQLQHQNVQLAEQKDEKQSEQKKDIRREPQQDNQDHIREQTVEMIENIEVQEGDQQKYNQGLNEESKSDRNLQNIQNEQENYKKQLEENQEHTH